MLNWISGLLYLNDCPHQPAIPIIFTVAGTITCLSNVINSFDKCSPNNCSPNNCNNSNESQKNRKTFIGIFNMLINLLVITCFITGLQIIYLQKTKIVKTKRLFIFSLYLCIWKWISIIRQEKSQLLPSNFILFCFLVT